MRRRNRNIVELRDQKGRHSSHRAKPRWQTTRAHTRRRSSILRPWRKVGVLLLIGAVVIGGRDALGYLGVKLSGSTACTVTSVVDGDTVRIVCPGRGLQSARLLGFDTPEVYSPKCFSEWWAGTKATWALRKHLWFADKVTIVLSGTDRYDRRLATLFVDGKNISSTMIAAGHARRYNGGKREGWCW